MDHNSNDSMQMEIIFHRVRVASKRLLSFCNECIHREREWICIFFLFLLIILWALALTLLTILEKQSYAGRSYVTCGSCGNQWILWSMCNLETLYHYDVWLHILCKFVCTFWQILHALLVFVSPSLVDFITYH